MEVNKVFQLQPNEFPAEGEACLDVMSDLSASNEFNLELVAVSTDSIPVHRWVAVVATIWRRG